MFQTKKCAVLMALLALVMSAGYIFGQATATGTIQGTVNDKSQAVVSGAEVTATFKATGATRTTTTNDSGSYRIDFATAGAYQIRVSKQGFQTVLENAELLVGSSTTVNVML